MPQTNFIPTLALTVALSVFSLFPLSHAAFAAPTTTDVEDAGAVIRLSKDAQGDLKTMDIAIQSYRNDSLTVDLVGAVHIADKSFYEDLNRRFQSYDAVLYELVAPEDSKPASSIESSENPISIFQGALATGLALSFQLDVVDYHATNFVHADLTPEQLAEAMSKRNESLFTYLARAVIGSMGKNNKMQEGGLQAIFAVLLIPDPKIRGRALRRLVAPQMVDMESMSSAIEGASGTALISDRNAAAIRVLHREIEKGKRRLAIFYGGAHLPDLGARLKKELGLSLTKTEWLPAWRLSADS